MRRHRLVCQVLVVVLALHGALGEEPADTSSRGSGSFSVIGTGEAVRPETAAPAAPAPGAQIKSKAQYTRTAIHVARSLDPSNEETIPVRTKTGDVASIIVKRRQRTGAGNGVTAGPPPYPVRSAVAARLAKAVPGAASSVRVPDPVDIQSSTVLVKPAEEGKVQQRARSMVQVDLDNAPVIEGVRVPDDENDKKYNWRGARVINNVLVPNNGSAGLPAEPLVGAGDKARVNQPPSPPAGPPAPPRLSAGPVDTVAAAAAATPNLPESLKLDAVKKLAESTAQSPWIPTSPDGANVVTPPLLTPQVHGLQSRAEQQRRILEYIRAVNQLEAGRAASRGRMMRNNEQSPAEARALQYQPALLYSAQSTNPTRVVSFEEGVRTPVLQYAHPELGVQPAKVAPPAPPAPARNQDRALAYFGQDIHADRSPFAREPGLDQPEEPAKPTSAKRSSPDAQTLAVNAASTATSTGLSSLPQRPKKVQPIEDSYGLASDKYIKRFPHAASYKDYRDYKDDYGHGYRYNSYRADPHYSSYSPSPFLEDARPFWVRLSDSIQDSMRTGMERMSDLARPVVDPLVEASAKISQNLGFTSGGANGVGGATRGAHGAQDRLGSVGAAVATPSMLLPALGLVAGGAALGLGAVAVGRYLDVDVMAKRSEASDEDDEDALEMEHKRALNALRAGQQRYLDASHTDGLDGRQVTDAEVVAQVIDVVNKQQHKQQQHQHHHQHQHQQAHSRTRRDSSANTLDSFELAEERRQLALRAAQLGAPTAVWGSTPCAQRVFCDVLSREGPDSALLMEKKMATLLAMLPRVAPEAAAVHLSAVMGAVRRGDCSVFVCPLTSAPRR